MLCHCTEITKCKQDIILSKKIICEIKSAQKINDLNDSMFSFISQYLDESIFITCSNSIIKKISDTKEQNKKKLDDLQTCCSKELSRMEGRLASLEKSDRTYHEAIDKLKSLK